MTAIIKVNPECHRSCIGTLLGGQGLRGSQGFNNEIVQSRQIGRKNHWIQFLKGFNKKVMLQLLRQSLKTLEGAPGVTGRT